MPPPPPPVPAPPPPPPLASPELDKARALMAKGDKKLGSWLAGLTGNKYEDAEEMYKKAANQFKVAKNCTDKFCVPVHTHRMVAVLLMRLLLSVP